MMSLPDKDSMLRKNLGGEMGLIEWEWKDT